MATHLINMVGVFEKLNEKKEEGLTVADLAAELGVHEPYLKFWCQTAYHFELLDCDDQGKFKLQPFLDETSPWMSIYLASRWGKHMSISRPGKPWTPLLSPRSPGSPMNRQKISI
jgi:hypothetical protein